MSKPQATQATQATKAVKATASKRTPPPSRKKGLEEMKWYWLAKRFMLNTPHEETGRNGRKYTIYHRFGPSGGAPTVKELYELSGAPDRIKNWERQAIKEGTYSDEQIAELRSLRIDREKKKVGSAVSLFRNRLKREYAKVGLVPLFGYVRLHSEDEDPRLYLQGFVDPSSAKERFVIGSRNDGALWAMTVKRDTEGIAERRDLALTLEKEFMAKVNTLDAAVRDRLTHQNAI